MTKSIYAALAKAQAEMGPALKDSVNPAFRSKYADLSSVMAACMPALNAAGIAVIQPTTQDENGNRFVKTIFAHGESGETVECAVPLIVAKGDMQGYGSAVTYARRYGLMCMAGVAPEDDDGNAAAAGPPPKDQARLIATQKSAVDSAVEALAGAKSLDELHAIWQGIAKSVQGETRVIETKNLAKSVLFPLAKSVTGDGDDIPY